MASSNDSDDKDVKFEESFRSYLKRSDSQSKSPLPDSLLEKLTRETPIHQTTPMERDTLRARDQLASDDPLEVARHTQELGIPNWSSASLEGVQLQGIYKIEQRIAKGGMAWVYRAWHENLQIPIALKILFPELVEESELYQRFLDEARMLAQLRHQHIVQVYDVLEDHGLLGMVLEWVDGQDLFEYLSRQPQPLSFPQVKQLFLPVLDAMQYIHERGIVHRDLKPDNILLQQEGDIIIPKVADFGIAKMADIGNARTRTGNKLGTPIYMSPEQIRDSKKADARSDVYSLGMILYEMMAGTPPFVGDDQWVLYQQVNEVPPSLHQHCRGLPDAFETIVQRCLEKQPEKRYQSCRELSAALTDVLEQYPDLQPTAETNPVVRPVVQTVKKDGAIQWPNPTLAWAVVALLVWALGLGWYNSWNSSTPKSGAHSNLSTAQRHTQTPPVSPHQPVYLTIRSEPSGAAVWKNHKQYLGKTPYLWEGKPGEVISFTLRKKGFLPKIVNGKTIQKGELFWTLEPAPPQPPQRPRTLMTTVLVRSTPKNANIWLGRRWRGKTPARIKLPVGQKSRLTFRLKNYESHTKVWRASHDRSRTPVIKLQRRRVRVLIHSRPSGAKVFYQGKRVGVTPFPWIRLAGEELTLRLIRSGYEPEKSIVKISEKPESKHNIKLTQKPSPSPKKRSQGGPPTGRDLQMMKQFPGKTRNKPKP